MSEPLVLNPASREIEHEPVDLSRQLLEAVRAGRSEARDLASQLHGVRPAELAGDESRISFWLNVYNALVADWLRAHPPRASMLREMRLFGTAAYLVGGITHTPDQIEHGLLRRNRRPPYRPRPLLPAGDARLPEMPSRFDVRIHFALNCGARSCPPIASYDADRLDKQLELATRSYLDAETEVGTNGGRVKLPGLMHLYRRDFGSKADALGFVADRIPAVRSPLERERRPRISYRRFDWAAVPPELGHEPGDT